jgi:hypothetical protein
MALRVRTALRVGRSRAPAVRVPRPDTPLAVRVALICLACGTTLTGALANGGALRCHDCRAADVPLDDALFELQRLLSGRPRRD